MWHLEAGQVVVLMLIVKVVRVVHVLWFFELTQGVFVDLVLTSLLSRVLVFAHLLLHCDLVRDRVDQRQFQIALRINTSLFNDFLLLYFGLSDSGCAWFLLGRLQDLLRR